eukprot:14189375-Alexandrium_andersonii.AAC.1
MQPPRRRSPLPIAFYMAAGRKVPQPLVRSLGSHACECWGVILRFFRSVVLAPDACLAGVVLGPLCRVVEVGWGP